MEIQFKNAGLQNLVESEKELTRHYSTKLAKQLELRMYQLKSSSNLEELFKVKGKWHPLKGNRKGQYAASLPGGERLIIKPSEPVPYKEDGGIDISKVDSIIVIAIEDYH